MTDIKAYLHVVYAAFGDASILEFQSGGKRRFYLVDGGPIRYVGAGGTEDERAKKITKLQLSRPYYQYLLYTLTSLAKIPNSTGIKLDGAIVTHPHADHLDGVERLFRELLPHSFQENVASGSPEKRLVCNGPVLLTRKFAQDGKAYRSFSEFLLKTKFEISLDVDDIQNAFGNDVVFSFPSSPGVLYQRHKPSDDDEPYAEDKQRSKLKGGTEDEDLNKSSIILYTKNGGKICLSGDAYGYDIVAVLRALGIKDLDIFKLPHHGSPQNSILGKVIPPAWVFQNLAAMVLLSLSLNQKTLFEENPEQQDDIDCFRQQLKGIAGEGNGETVQRVADTFLEVLKARLKNKTDKITPEELLNRIKGKHLEILAAIQQQSGQRDPCENLEGLEALVDWENQTKSVACSLTCIKSATSALKKRKIDWWPLIINLMGSDNIFQDYFAAKIGIDGFFESFHSKTYYVSANRRYGHPSADVIKGIIRAAVTKNKPCKIVFTSGAAVPSSYLPDVKDKRYKEWNKLVSLYYLKDNVSFKLDPTSDVNIAPTGTSKLENDDNIRIDVSKQVNKNYGFTIPQRSFLPNLDKYYVKTKGSNQKCHWLTVNSDGTLFLTSKKSVQNIINVSNALSINGDLRVITLQEESSTAGQHNVWLEEATGGGFLIKGSATANYFFEENGSLKSTNRKSEAATFFFDHKTFSGPMKSERTVSLMEFLKSLGFRSDQKPIIVRSALEILLGFPNMERLIKELPAGSFGNAALNSEVNFKLSTVELSSSVDSEVVSSKIEAVLQSPSMSFDSSPVTKLEIVVKEPCSKPNVSLLISTLFGNVIYTLNVSEHLKPKEPSVDMYLNALGGVPLEDRNKLTVGTLLERVMGRLPLKCLSNCLPTHLLALELFTWKVDRFLSTVNYFSSPLAVEVLSGDFYISIPPGKNQVTFGETVVVDLSQIHVMVRDPRTERSNFVIECAATIGSIPVNLKMASSSANVPSVIISFSNNPDYRSVFTILELGDSILDLSVPVVNKVMQNLQLSNPSICVVQDVQDSRVTRVSSLSFEFSFDNFASILPSGFSSPQDCSASVTIFNPLSCHIQVGFEVEFKLPVSSSTDAKAFFNSKFSLWPVDASNHESSHGYACSIALRPNPSGISTGSALQAIGLGHQMTSMNSIFPFIAKILNGILLDQISLEVDCEKHAINSFSLSLFVSECSIIEGKVTMQDASILVQYGCDQWYAKTEMKLLVFNKFVCSGAFSLPKPNEPGMLTFENSDDSLTLNEFFKGIGIAIAEDVPIIKEVLDVRVSRVAITCNNDGPSFKFTKIEVVIKKRKLAVGRINIYNLELEVCHANFEGKSSVSISLQGYLNPKTHASLAYHVERRELLGHYILIGNMSTNDCLNALFAQEMRDFSNSNAFQQVKSLHVREVKVTLSFARGKQWSLKQFLVSMEGFLSLGPLNLHQLCIQYISEHPDEAKRHISVIGRFKSDDQTLSFIVELSCTSHESKSTSFKAAIKPDAQGGLTLSSLLKAVALKSPEDKVPQVDGSPDFLNIEMKEAFMEFEVSPFKILKLDVVIKTTTTMKILEKPLIELQEARLEYHLDATREPAQTEIFIGGSFFIGASSLNVTLKEGTKKGFLLKGNLSNAEGSEGLDFEQAAKQLSPGVAVSLPKNVALSSFWFRLEKGEEATSLELEGESHSCWTIDAGFSNFTVQNLGGKLHFGRDRSSNAWTGFVCLTGNVLLQQSVVVAVEIYHATQGETVAYGIVSKPETIDIDVMTRTFAAGSDSSKSWKEVVPKETETAARSPKFIRASLVINFSTEALLLYGVVAGFGTGMLMVKKTAPDENSSGYGFLFALNLGSDFRFSAVNQSLSVVDEVISVQYANLSVISMEKVAVAELLKDISKLQPLGHQQQLDDAPFTNLESQPVSELRIKRGMTLFAKINFSKGQSKLLSNITQIQRREKHSEIVLFAHIAETGKDTVFMAQIAEMELFGGHLTFHEITLAYQPSKGKTLSLNGKMSLMLTEDSLPIVFSGTLEISESNAIFSMKVGIESDTIHQPFGMCGMSFEDPQLHLCWKFDQDEPHSMVPLCSISATVKFGSCSKDTPVTTLRGSILFQEGKPVVAMVSLEYSQPLSIDDLFITVFKELWPSGYLDISFKKGEIYYAKADYEVAGKTYKEGFRGQTEIQIFDHTFGVELSIDTRGVEVKGFSKFEIDLVFAALTGENFDDEKGPEINISRYKGHTKFQLSTGVRLLQEKLGSCSLGYDVQEKCFIGEVTYSGELLGVTNPSVEFDWSQKDGFKIRKWPAILNLQKIIDFAKEFEKLSQMIDSPCEELVGLAFDQVIKTKCRLNVASVEECSDPAAWFVLRLQGKLDVMIITDKPSVTVDFPEMIVAITKPSKQFRLSDLPGFLIGEIAKNSLQIAKQVFSQPDQLTKFMAALGGIKLSRKLLSGLICRGVRSPNVTSQAAAELEIMEREVHGSESLLRTLSRELASAAEAGASLVDLAILAVKVLGQVAFVVAALKAIISFIKGIIRFFTGKSKEQKEAEKRREEAQRKGEQARKIVEDRLVVSNLTMNLPELDEVEVCWKPLEENVEYSMALWRVDLGGVETVLLETTTENNKVKHKSDSVRYNSQQFKVSVQASYLCRDVTFKGKEQLLSKDVKPLLPPPSTLEAQSTQDGREVHVRFSQVKYAVDYKAEVITHDGSIIGTAIIKRPPENKEVTYVFCANNLTAGVPGKAQVGVCSRVQNEGPEEFKYSSDLYLVATPADLHLSYEPASQLLSVKWKVSDTKKISRFLCEIQSVNASTVDFSKEVAMLTGDNLNYILKVNISEISEKANSPYVVRLCSLGEQAALASVFVSSRDHLSFLPQVQGISQSYDPQSNQLTVTWVPVTGATKYEVTIKEKTNSSSVARKLTSDGKKGRLVCNMDEIQLKSGVNYVLSIIAEGSDALHLPSMPFTADTEFAQLPKPASVNQEYSFEERRVKVNFQCVPEAAAHLIEVVNKTTPTIIASRHVVPKPAGSWPPTMTYSFEVDNMNLDDGGPLMSHVIAQGNTKWINSPPRVSATELKCSKAPTNVSLKYNIQSRQLEVAISSRPGEFTLTIEDTAHESKKVSKQFVVGKDFGIQSLYQTLFNFPLNPDEEPRGATYQASVINDGDQQYLPSEVKQSNEVLLLDPPASVTQECKNGVFTVAWKCVQSAAGYTIKVFNTKTKRTSFEEKITRDYRPVENQMKKDFDVLSMLLESNGLYQSLVMVLGDEINIGGASTKSKSTIPSCPSPLNVSILFNNETRLMRIGCYSVDAATAVRLGVINADKIKDKEANFQEALLGYKVLASNAESNLVKAEFDDSVLIKSLDGSHKGFAQILKTGEEVSLPSGFSISQKEVTWLRPALPIHMTFDPVNSTLKITWTPVNLALRYEVEIIQTRKEQGETTTLVPFSDEVPGEAFSCSVNTENFAVKEIDNFQAKLQPKGVEGLVITLHSTGYSTETLICENSPKKVDVLQVEDKSVKVTWKGYSSTAFELCVWKMLKEGAEAKVSSKQTTNHQLTSTSEALQLCWPGWYRFGVRAKGSSDKLHSVYTKSDFLAVIMDAPVAIAMRKRPAVTLQWSPVDNIATQDFSHYVISYHERETDSDWKQVEVELSATEKTLEDLKPDTDYLFCISVASAKRGIGIKSSATVVHTDAEVGMPGNLLDNPNFAPVAGWDETGFAYNIITEPWQFIQPSARQYRLENTPQGTGDWPEQDGNYRWSVAAANVQSPCWRVQTIDLLAKGFTPEYLDETKPPIEVYEWFAVKKGLVGAYDIKVSLLDSNKRKLPEESPFFALRTRKAASSDGSWEWLGHTFVNYPPGLRFIRFEDVLRCWHCGLDKWAYDVKAFGATVKFSTGQ